MDRRLETFLARRHHGWCVFHVAPYEYHLGDPPLGISVTTGLGVPFDPPIICEFSSDWTGNLYE